MCSSTRYRCSRCRRQIPLVTLWLDRRLARPTVAEFLDEPIAALCASTDPQRDRGDVAVATAFAALARALAALVMIDRPAIANSGR